MKTIVVLTAVLLMTVGGASAFIFQDPDQGIATLPENRTFSIREVRKQMTIEELRLDERIMRGELVLHDGRVVLSYAFSREANVIVGVADQSIRVRIEHILPVNPGREVQTLFLNDQQETVTPPAEDIGVWTKDFERIGHRVAEKSETATRVHVALSIDKSGSMKPFMDQVKAAGTEFLSHLPRGAKCTVSSFNRLVQTHVGGNLGWVNYDGIFLKGVQDMAPESAKPVNFAKQYPDAVTKYEIGKDDQLRELIKTGNWGVDCAKAGASINGIQASGGTDVYLPLLLNLRAAKLSQSVPGIERYKHIVVLITDGGHSKDGGLRREDILTLKEEVNSTIFLYLAGNTDSTALEGIGDYELRTTGEVGGLLTDYLSNIQVFIQGQTTLRLDY